MNLYAVMLVRTAYRLAALMLPSLPGLARGESFLLDTAYVMFP